MNNKKLCMNCYYCSESTKGNRICKLCEDKYAYSYTLCKYANPNDDCEKYMDNDYGIFFYKVLPFIVGIVIGIIILSL